MNRGAEPRDFTALLVLGGGGAAVCCVCRREEEGEEKVGLRGTAEVLQGYWAIVLASKQAGGVAGGRSGAAA